MIDPRYTPTRPTFTRARLRLPGSLKRVHRTRLVRFDPVNFEAHAPTLRRSCETHRCRIAIRLARGRDPTLCIAPELPHSLPALTPTHHGWYSKGRHGRDLLFARAGNTWRGQDVRPRCPIHGPRCVALADGRLEIPYGSAAAV